MFPAIPHPTPPMLAADLARLHEMARFAASAYADLAANLEIARSVAAEMRTPTFYAASYAVAEIASNVGGVVVRELARAAAQAGPPPTMPEDALAGMPLGVGHAEG